MTETMNRFALLLGSLGQQRSKLWKRINRGQADLAAYRLRNSEERIHGNSAQSDEKMEEAYAADLSAVFGRLAVDNALTLLVGLIPVRPEFVYNTEEDLRCLEKRLEVSARTYGIARDVVARNWLEYAENELQRSVQYLERSSGASSPTSR